MTTAFNISKCEPFGINSKSSFRVPSVGAQCVFTTVSLFLIELLLSRALHSSIKYYCILASLGFAFLNLLGGLLNFPGDLALVLIVKVNGNIIGCSPSTVLLVSVSL